MLAERAKHMLAMKQAWPVSERVLLAVLASFCDGYRDVLMIMALQAMSLVLHAILMKLAMLEKFLHLRKRFI